MSYRLITKATLTITSAAGVTLPARIVECRAYPAPKRDAAGAITVDGVEQTYHRTGGKGRGTLDQRYMYTPVKGQSAFFGITESEATALVGGRAVLELIAAPVAATPTPAEPVVQIDGPTVVVDGVARAADSDVAVKAARRVRRAAAEA